jgi:hypothetical protein
MSWKGRVILAVIMFACAAYDEYDALTSMHDGRAEHAVAIACIGLATALIGTWYIFRARRMKVQ